MKIRDVVIIGGLAALGFVGLMVYGLFFSKGAPMPFHPPERIGIEAPRLDRHIDLADGIDPEVWSDLPSARVEMIYQVTVLPWPRQLVPYADVRVFHNGRQIFFYLTWPDATPDRLLDAARFSDACALMFPLGTDVDPASIMMGFLGKSSIWHWKACRDAAYWDGEAAPQHEKAYSDYYYPFEDRETLPVMKGGPDGPVVDLFSVRVATVSPKDRQLVRGRGLWTNDFWHVVIKREMAPEDADPELDAVFAPGGRMLCAFGLWNGSAGDRGGRKSISDFVEISIQE